MKNYLKNLRRQAEERLSKILGNDDEWELFVKQVRQYGIDLNETKNAREIANKSEFYFQHLRELYIQFVLTPICDTCNYNPHQRSGQRRFKEKRVFYCDWRESWIDFSRGERHTDKTKPPKWLDVQNNLCSHFYAKY